MKIKLSTAKAIIKKYKNFGKVFKKKNKMVFSEEEFNEQLESIIKNKQKT